MPFGPYIIPSDFTAVIFRSASQGLQRQQRVNNSLGKQRHAALWQRPTAQQPLYNFVCL